MSMECKGTSYAEVEKLQTVSVLGEKYDLRDNCKKIFKVLASANVGG